MSIDMVIRMKETVQLVPPALAGRKQRIADFRQFIEANRKTKTSRQIVALYGLETGISVRTTEGYLKLFIEAGFYARPLGTLKGRLLTPKERDIFLKKLQRKRQEEQKQRETEINQYDF